MKMNYPVFVLKFKKEVIMKEKDLLNIWLKENEGKVYQHIWYYPTLNRIVIEYYLVRYGKVFQLRRGAMTEDDSFNFSDTVRLKFLEKYDPNKNYKQKEYKLDLSKLEDV